MYQIIFSDADGTLLDSNHCVLPHTREALQMLKIPFVIVSGRYPCGIYSIMRKNGLKGPIISCGGALILDEERRLLYQHGMTKAQTAMVTAEIDAMPYDATWNIFSWEDWLVRDPSHPRIRHEEKLLDAVSRAGSAADLAEDQQAHKVLCMCEPEETALVERYLQTRLPQLTVVRSSPILVEIMQKGVNKAHAIEWLCRVLGISAENAIAFGDNYNDLEMLHAVGHPIVMENAPGEIRAMFSDITTDNDHDGIVVALKRLKLI